MIVNKNFSSVDLSQSSLNSSSSNNITRSIADSETNSPNSCQSTSTWQCSIYHLSSNHSHRPEKNRKTTSIFHTFKYRLCSSNDVHCSGLDRSLLLRVLMYQGSTSSTNNSQHVIDNKFETTSPSTIEQWLQLAGVEHGWMPAAQ